MAQHVCNHPLCAIFVIRQFGIRLKKLNDKTVDVWIRISTILAAEIQFPFPARRLLIQDSPTTKIPFPKPAKALQ